MLLIAIWRRYTASSMIPILDNFDPKVTACSAKCILRPSGRDCTMSNAPEIAVRILLSQEIILFSRH